MADENDITLKFNTVGSEKVLADVAKQRQAFQNLTQQLSATSSLATVMGLSMGGAAGQMAVFVDSAVAASGAATKLAKSLKEISLASTVLAAAAIAAIATTGFFIKKAIDANKAEKETRDATADSIVKTAQAINDEILAREKSGRLTREEARDFRLRLGDITTFLALQRELKSSAGVAEAGRRASQMARDMAVASTAFVDPKMLEAERQLTLADFEARAEMTRAHAEFQTALDQSISINTVQDLKDSVTRREEIIRQSHDAERNLLDARGRDLLQRQRETILEDEKLVIEGELRKNNAAVKALEDRRRAQQAELVAFNNSEVLRLTQERNRLELADLQAKIALQRDQLAIERAMVENDFTLNDVEKRDRLLAIAREEQRVLEAQVKTLRERKALLLPDDVRGRQQLTSEIQSAETQARSSGASVAGTQAQADPRSIREQMVLTFTQLESQFGTTAQIIARGFSTIIGSAVDGVARSVAGLLNLTMTWGEALRNIGTSIVQGIITSFAQMVSEWVISHVLMKGVLLAFSAFGLTLKTKETASTIALETAKTPVLTLNAGLASASSYGAAAFIGLAALIAIIAVLASMSFDTGGYTGSGSRSQPAGIVHREEFVMNAAATSRIGVPTLEAMQAGEPVVAESGQRVSLVLVDSRERAEALDVGESRKQIIQVMAEEMHNFRTG